MDRKFHLDKHTEKVHKFFINIFPFFGLFFVILFFSFVTGGNLLSRRNVSMILVQSIPLFICATGTSFLFSQNILDMSMGSVVGLAAAFIAYASNFSPFLTILVAVCIGLGVGLLNGVLHAVLHINPLIETMAVSFIIRGLLQPLCGYGCVGASMGFLAWDNDILKIGIAVALFIIAYIFFEYRPLGKNSRIVGANEVAAIQSGISITATKITGFVISSVGAGMAGFMMMLRSGSALPSTGNFFEFDVIIALVLGGMPITGGMESKIRSAFIGTMILTILTNGMTLWGIDEYPQQITKGLIFLAVLAIYFAFRNGRDSNR
jgi:ribose transport system permease protein